MWGKILKALIIIIKNAPAVVEVVKKTRERHPDQHEEPIR